jgi:hypothetical protein
VGRDRQYRTNAERQRAYRERKAARDRAGWDEARRLRREGATRATTRQRVSARLVRVLGMLGSAFPGERDNAAVAATRILREAGLTWYDVLDIADEE